jgi:hypothetical protein
MCKCVGNLERRFEFERPAPGYWIKAGAVTAMWI